MRPLIGISCHVGKSSAHNREKAIDYCNKSYIQAIESAGGIPILIPALQDLSELQRLLLRLDGLLLPGGPDIASHLYHEQPHPLLGNANPHLDTLELALAQWAIQEKLPTLGICRGMQLLNVALGGNLYQDLGSQYPDSLQHAKWEFPRNLLAHQVRIKPGSRMEQIFGTNVVEANSLHHQAIKNPGTGVTITGYTNDGVAELMEVADHPFMMATQCHPEEIYMDEPVWAQLFTALIDASTKRILQQVPDAESYAA